MFLIQYTFFFILVQLITFSHASIIDNRTTNDTDTELIRALRQFPISRNAQDYQLAPYHEDYYGRTVDPDTRPREQRLQPLRENKRCTAGKCDSAFDAYEAWPFIFAGVFIVMAVLVYVTLFFFVFRTLV